jgi:hypothetical protein
VDAVQTSVSDRPFKDIKIWHIVVAAVPGLLSGALGLLAVVLSGLLHAEQSLPAGCAAAVTDLVRRLFGL